MDYNDYELVYMVKENDDNAFDLIMAKYEPLIKKLCFFYVQKYRKFNIDMEDLMQECRITLYNALSKYDQDKEILFYSFILVCVKRKISSYIRKCAGPSRYRDTISLDDDDNYLQFEDKYCYEPDYLLDDEYILIKIIDFKNMLSFEDSLVFELRYNGFSYKEISILLDINIKTVDNRLLKIKNKLKKYLLEIN